MNDVPPLKLQLPAGSYRTKWHALQADGSVDPDVLWDGDLVLEAGKPPQVTVSGDLPVESTVTEGGATQVNLPQEMHVPIVRGWTASNVQIVLVDVHLHMVFPSQGMMWGRAALVAPARADVADDMKFDQLDIQISNLHHFAGTGPIKFYEWPQPESDQRRWSITEGEQIEASWADDDASLSINYVRTISAPDPFEFRYQSSPYLTIKLSSPLDLNGWVEQWMDPLVRIVSASTNRQDQITYASFTGSSAKSQVTRPYQVPAPKIDLWGSNLHQKPFAASTDLALARSVAFRASSPTTSLLHLVRTWQRLETERHPLVETYGQFLGSSPQHPRAEFLLLVQSLEGLDGFDRRFEYQRQVDTHEARRAALMDRAIELLSQEDFRFLKKFLMTRPRSGLDDALRRCLVNLPVDLTTPLGETTLLKTLRAAEPTITSTESALRWIRNDLAHGTRGYAPSEISEIAELLKRVTRAHLLRVLGCDAEAQGRALAPED